MNRATQAALERVLGSPIARAEPVAGGDINQALRLTLGDGRRAFAKLNASAPPGFFESEARGLAWLREAGALAVPELIGVGAPAQDGGELACLLLGWVEPARRLPDFDEQLGAGLAALHRASPGRFGLDHDNFIALLPQDNRSAPDWATFYAEHRLLPLAERARALGHADLSLLRAMERLCARLPELVGPAEPPARLHGDLWGGNLLVGERGQPLLIDPAVYAGQREIDLAMMRLFGGFSERVFSAYAESYPLAAGADERVELSQLYPLLVHLVSFGAGYLGSVRRCVARYA